MVCRKTARVKGDVVFRTTLLIPRSAWNALVKGLKSHRFPKPYVADEAERVSALLAQLLNAAVAEMLADRSEISFTLSVTKEENR